MKKVYFILPILLFCVVFAYILSDLLTDAKYTFMYSESDTTSPMLIIDAGHGGADGGAVSDNGTVEADINLDIALKLRYTAYLFGIPSIMTRESGDITYPDEVKTLSKMKQYDQQTRKNMINSTQNGILISIHQNIFPSKRPYGTQVLYADNEESKRMGELFQADLVTYLQDENYRTAAKISDSIYLFKKLNIPAILIECGFLSNDREEALLNTEEYRLKISSIVLSSYNKYLLELK